MERLIRPEKVNIRDFDREIVFMSFLNEKILLFQRLFKTTEIMLAKAKEDNEDNLDGFTFMLGERDRIIGQVERIDRELDNLGLTHISRTAREEAKPLLHALLIYLKKISELDAGCSEFFTVRFAELQAEINSLDRHRTGLTGYAQAEENPAYLISCKS